MKLNVEIESSSFEKVITEGINSLTKEEVKDIIKQVVYEAFTKCETMSSMLIQWERPNSWNSVAEPTLGPMMQLALKEIDLGPDIIAIKEKMVNDLMEHHRDIVEETILKLLVEKFTYENNLQEAIRSTTYKILSDMRNGN